MKVLIVRFSSIGDVVLTTPVIRAIRNTYPSSQVHYLTKEANLPLLKSNPYLNKIYTITNSLKPIIGVLRSEHYDYVIDLHHNLRTTILKLKLRSISFTFDKVNVKKWLLVNSKLDILPNKHIVQRYLDTTKTLKVRLDNKGLDYFIPQNEGVDFSLVPPAFRANYIGFVIGGSFLTKKLPTNKAIELIRKLNFSIFLIGGKEDYEEGLKIKNAIGDKVYNGCGIFTVNQSASIVKEATCVITNDTGMMHIAAAFRRQIISLWGNTTPKFGMYPYMPGVDSLKVEVDGLSCRPCSKLGFSACPKKHFKCMNDLDLDKIAERANLIMRKYAV